MDTALNEQNQEHIRRKLESGRYSSPDDVIARALKLLDEHDEELARELAEVRAKVGEGVDQLRNGRYTVYDQDGLEELKGRIKRQGSERSKGQDQPHS
jgi:putative addiction module CopG family antidote